MFKKIFCFALCFILSFNLCCCGKSTINNSTQKETDKKENVLENISMLYCRADTFNPYTAVSDINRQLCKLLYEPLITTDNTFNPIYRLAETITFGDKTCTVTLKDVLFSDGATLTADDVVYSFSKAKTSSTSYASKLYEVENAAVIDKKTVLFTLSKNDPYFENLLDFPILKSESDVVTDSDGVIQPPIGCGRYILSDDKNSLCLNENFYGKLGKIKKISLIDTPDADAVSHYVEVGAVSFYYADLANGSIVRMSGKKSEVYLNNLVYIGINDSVDRLNNKYMRYAISSAIGRLEICSNAYHNNASPATGFFNPYFQPVSAVQSLSDEANLKIAIENLDKIGYNRLNSESYYVNSAGKRASFNLLVNSENRSRVLAAYKIKDQLRAAGIEITVVEKDYDKYVADLSAGNFQLYLGEINILPNMDLSQLVIAGGSAAYGRGTVQTEAQEETDEIKTDIIADAIARFYDGSVTINDVAGVLLTEMPQIPICYRKGLLFYDEKISGVKVSESDIYLTIESYTNKN
ncbi:MAG: ABC transporter substrate-binding protein [Clostridia bacterium]|nr:ABC transporter substrate-binding protein [Clostridia bacterium]